MWHVLALYIFGICSYVRAAHLSTEEILVEECSPFSGVERMELSRE